MEHFRVPVKILPQVPVNSLDQPTLVDTTTSLALELASEHLLNKQQYSLSNEQGQKLVMVRQQYVELRQLLSAQKARTERRYSDGDIRAQSCSQCGKPKSVIQQIPYRGSTGDAEQWRYVRTDQGIILLCPPCNWLRTHTKNKQHELYNLVQQMLDH
jgi:hypothetical protein